MRVSPELRSSGRMRESAWPNLLLSLKNWSKARPRSSETPTSRFRRLFNVCGRMNAPLSSNSRTGDRLFSVRLRMNPLEVVNLGRSHEVIAGVSASAVVRFRSRSTPTGTPSRNFRSAYARRPNGLESG